MATKIDTAANMGVAPICVPDNMPEDELLDAMQAYAAEVDAQTQWVGGDAFTVRAWPNGAFRVSEVVEYRHKRQRYDAALVAELIAEDYR